MKNIDKKAVAGDVFTNIIFLILFLSTYVLFSNIFFSQDYKEQNRVLSNQFSQRDFNNDLFRIDRILGKKNFLFVVLDSNSYVFDVGSDSFPIIDIGDKEYVFFTDSSKYSKYIYEKGANLDVCQNLSYIHYGSYFNISDLRINNSNLKGMEDNDLDFVSTYKSDIRDLNFNPRNNIDYMIKDLQICLIGD